MKEPKLVCPECESKNVAVTAESMWMVNTEDFYCHSVKTQDNNAVVTCLDCRWVGKRDELIVKTRKK